MRKYTYWAIYRDVQSVDESFFSNREAIDYFKCKYGDDLIRVYRVPLNIIWERSAQRIRLRKPLELINELNSQSLITKDEEIKKLFLECARLIQVQKNSLDYVKEKMSAINNIVNEDI
jgi:hypothetical protein